MYIKIKPELEIPVKRVLSFLLMLTLAAACAPLSLTPSANTDEPIDIYSDPAEVPTSTTSIRLSAEYGQAARRHIEALTAIGARLPGSEQEIAAQEYIVSTFEAMGYQPEVQPFTAAGDDDTSTTSANVAAVKPGASSQVIVVGAHYDSSDESLGADDNASGVGVLLEAAALVKNASTPYTIDFVTFGAEEAGLLGSQAFVSSMSASETSNIILFINMDSIGAGDITYIYSPENESTARDWAMNWAGANQFDLQTIQNVSLSQNGEASADYAAFEQAGIPWIYFEATNWTLGKEDGYTQVDPQYGNNGAIIHTQYDNLQYLDQSFPGRVDQHMNLYVNVLHQILTAYQP
jgi:alkaline phosphatase isozyme conversion protein